MTRIILLFTMIAISYIAKAQDLENTLLWKVSGKNIETPSYLYGTMHVVCEVNFDEDVNKALEETTQMYLELDMDEPNFQMEMMKLMMMKDGTTLKSLLSVEDQKTLNEFLIENLGYDLSLLNNLKPFFISSMLYPKIIDCDMKAVDLELMAISKKQNEAIFGLELVQEQMKIFDDIDYKVQLDELMKSVKDNLKNDKVEMKELQEIYKSENISKMLEVMLSSDNKLMSDYNDVMLTNRNKNWIPIIEKAMSTPTFFAFGAGHLAGENGVINLLIKEGYTVEPVK
jgi:uncharacterized protein